MVPFHGHEPIKPFITQSSNTLIQPFFPNREYVFALQDAINKYVSETKLELTEMYNKHRAYIE